jgi:hypothetical protein
VAGSDVTLASAIVDRDGRTWTIDELSNLVNRARKDDAAALETLERSFSANQWWWGRLGGDIAWQAEERLVRASATSEFVRLAVRKTLERTRDELAGGRPTPLVSLAAKRAALCGLEADLAYRTSAGFLADGGLPPEAVQSWLDRADKRHRSALKTLADLQRLQLPAVQVDVGGRQVNIASGQVNLPGSAGEPAPATILGAPGPVLASSTTATGSQTTGRSRGRRGPEEAATQELGEGLPSLSEAAGAALVRPDEFLPSECPTSGTGGTMLAAGGSPPRLGAPPAADPRAARRRVPPLKMVA